MLPLSFSALNPRSGLSQHLKLQREAGDARCAALDYGHAVASGSRLLAKCCYSMIGLTNSKV